MTTARKLIVTDEQLGQYARKTRDLQARLEKGTLDFDATIRGIQDLIEGRTSAMRGGVASAGIADPFAGYRKVKGLVFIGPGEWEKAMASRNRRNRNPLKLVADWCPHLSIPWMVDQMKKLVELCQTPEWNTTPILYLAIPEVAGTPTSLVGQYSWWGVPHNSMGPGSIRQDVFWANWYHSRDDVWKDEPAVTEPTWMIGYEHPRWTTEKNWLRQREVVADHGMAISTVAQDTLMLNLRLASAGERLRSSTWSRTSTLCDGCPLFVRSDGHGVDVGYRWDLDDAYGALAASVHGMPLELVS